MSINNHNNHNHNNHNHNNKNNNPNDDTVGNATGDNNTAQGMDVAVAVAARSRRVLRFEFSNAMVEHLTAFAKMHQYDDRKTYKEAWAEWMANAEIATLFNADAARLKGLGYTGNIADKLYKSGRYYFRGAPNDANERGKRMGSGASAPRKYIMLSHELLAAMDEHIERGLRQQTDFRPASGFAEFCQLDVASYHSEIARLSELMNTGEDVSNKLKKTYKNRYFIMVHHDGAS